MQENFVVDEFDTSQSEARAETSSLTDPAQAGAKIASARGTIAKSGHHW